MQVLTDELAEDAVALAVEDAHARHAYEDGIVDEILHGGQSLVATHTAHVYVLMEVGTTVVDGLARGA